MYSSINGINIVEVYKNSELEYIYYRSGYDSFVKMDISYCPLKGFQLCRDCFYSFKTTKSPCNYENISITEDEMMEEIISMSCKSKKVFLYNDRTKEITFQMISSSVKLSKIQNSQIHQSRYKTNREVKINNWKLAYRPQELLVRTLNTNKKYLILLKNSSDEIWESY